jgi:uncharacterized membrane protein
MPPIFKALATIMAWVLWVAALLYGISAFILGIINGTLYGTDEPAPIAYAAHFAAAGFYAIVAVVIMILRKKMD